MRAKSLHDMLLYEAKRKPAIADLVARAGSMSDAEFAAISVPLPWYRKALDELRDRLRRLPDGTPASEAGQMALILANATYGHVHDPMGEILEWRGGEQFVSLGPRGLVLITPGEMVWCADTGGVWFDHIFSDTIDPVLRQLTRSLGRASKLGYAARASQRRQGLADASTPSLNAAPPPLLAAGVRFTRH